MGLMIDNNRRTLFLYLLISILTGMVGVAAASNSGAVINEFTAMNTLTQLEGVSQ